MVEAIPKEMKDLWDNWNIRGLVILSLALQTILVLLSPNRKRTHWRYFRLLIWSSYLLATWAAEYAVGQISESQGEDPQPKNNDLLAFWSTFLLLHLGGSDTLTALALEDNDLWLRSLFGLVSQAIVTLYIFLLSIPNNLLIPTSLMLVAGNIKYVERIKALRGASLETFKSSMLGKPDPGPDYARLVEEYSTRKMLGEPVRIVRIREAEKGQKPEVSERPDTVLKLTHLKVVQHAYNYFNIFKGLVVDLIFDAQSEQWNKSKELFRSLKAEEALRILEVELSFIYGTFYTKVDILHTPIGVAFRLLSLAFLLSSTVIFILVNKHDYDRFDVGLTYALLIGGIVLDFVAMLILCVSDWTFVRWRKPEEDVQDKDTQVDAFLNWILSFRELKWKSCDCYHKKGNSKCKVLDRKFIFRRWSEHIYAYNLIGYSLGIKPLRTHKTMGCIHEFFDKIICRLHIDRAISRTSQRIGYCFRTTKDMTENARSGLSSLIYPPRSENRVLICVLCPVKLFLRFWFGIPMVSYLLHFFGISDQLNGMIYTSRHRITKEMWKFIFKEVKRKSEIADTIESPSEIYSARGEWVLQEKSIGKGRNVALCKKLLHYVTEVDYDQSILMWHIATELLYQTEVRTENNWNREFSKILSDYMMYLLIMQPALMSTVAGIDKIRFMEAKADARDLADVKKFLLKRCTNSSNEMQAYEEIKEASENTNQENEELKTACEVILTSLKWLKETEGKRYQDRNVLVDANRLVNIVNKLSGEGMKWEIVSKVWVEMLCYAAAYCDPKQHVAQLSKGGEFISFVWLLMAHLGLGDQFQTTEKKTTAELIVDK